MPLDGVTWTVDDLDGSGGENVIVKEIGSSYVYTTRFEKRDILGDKSIRDRSNQGASVVFCLNVNPNEDLAHLTRAVFISLCQLVFWPRRKIWPLLADHRKIDTQDIPPSPGFVMSYHLPDEHQFYWYIYVARLPHCEQSPK